MESKSIIIPEFSTLPCEIKLHILSFLNQRQLALMRCVNKEFLALANDSSLENNPLGPSNYNQTPYYFDFASSFTEKITNVLTVLPSGNIILRREDETIFSLHQGRTGKCLMAFKGHTDDVLQVAGLSEGKLISCSRDMTLRIWEIATGRCIYTLIGQEQPLSFFKFIILSNDRVLSIASKDIKLWDPNSGSCLATFLFTDSFRKDPFLLPNDQLLCRDGKIYTWSVEQINCVRQLPKYGTYSNIEQMLVLPNNQIVIASKFTIEVWDSSMNQALNLVDTTNLADNTKHIRKIIALSKGTIVGILEVDNSDKQTLQVWDSDTDTGKCLQVIEISYHGKKFIIEDLAALSNNHIAILGHSELDFATNQLRIWDLTTEKCTNTIKINKEFTALSVLPTGQILLFSLGFLVSCKVLSFPEPKKELSVAPRAFVENPSRKRGRQEEDESLTTDDNPSSLKRSKYNP